MAGGVVESPSWDASGQVVEACRKVATEEAYHQVHTSWVAYCHTFPEGVA